MGLSVPSFSPIPLGTMVPSYSRLPSRYKKCYDLLPSRVKLLVNLLQLAALYVSIDLRCLDARVS